MTFAQRVASIMALAMLAYTAGCSTIENVGTDLGIGDQVVEEQEEYQDIIKPYLVKGEVYRHLGTEMLCKALPLTSKVRKGLGEIIADARGLDQATRKRNQEESARIHAKHFVVAFAFYVPDRKRNNLSGTRPDWFLYLINKDGQRQSPSDIRRLKYRSDLNGAIYPFWGLWDKLYLVRFDRQKDGKPFIHASSKTIRMLITGARGRTTLTLRLE